ATLWCFFFQAEDGIRDWSVTGVQTCALPICFLDDDFADFSRVMAVNVLGAMVGTQEAARHMAAHGGGSIINVTSIGGITAGRSEIGRASCRERGEGWVGGVMVKKKRAEAGGC